MNRVAHRRRVPGAWLAAAVMLAGLSACATTAAIAAPASTSSAPATSSGVSFDGKTYTNRLIHSHDPYLLMHAHNPVDWYPWGPQAFAKARRENKPIFLSVGYSTCYWCHVAEREIYADPAIAKLMNRWFVNIKVDREQRPDVDRIYMLATQILTGGGGWPNNVFLTPELKPFFAGSYFPPKDQAGRPGFPKILASLHRGWINDHAQLIDVSAQVYRAMRQVEQTMTSGGGKPAPATWLQHAVQQAAARFDDMDGGFPGNDATQFPQEPVLAMLLADYQHTHDAKALAMATTTLQAMAEGGVMDQLAGGFHRYSVEPGWSIPHFEKMLDDNAQLLGLYAHAYALTQQPLFKQVALRTAHYLVAAMQAPDGGFYNAQDSQVGNVEGVSYVWTRAQIEAVLGKPDAERFLALYMLTAMPESHAGSPQPHGGVLRLDRNQAMPLADRHHLAARIDALAPLRDKLLAARQRRPQPGRDEKIVTAGNALAILGFLQAGQMLKEPTLTRTAIDTAQGFWTHAFAAKTGLLRHQFFHGHAGDGGFLDDYALLGQAFLALHTATGDVVWRTRARQVADAMLRRFARPDGSLASTSDDTDLLVAPPIAGDQMRPSGQSAAVALLLGLRSDGGDPSYGEAAYRALSRISTQIDARPYAWGSLLASLSRPSLRTALDHASASIRTTRSLPGSADHVHGIAQRTPAGALRVTLDIDKGYHINANPASGRYLIPTQLSADPPVRLQVNYPGAEIFKAAFAPQGLAVYTGRVVLHAQLAPSAPALPHVTVRVQACNDQLCLAPARVEIPVQLIR